MKAPLSITDLKRILVLTALLAGLPALASSQPVKEFFKLNCTSCHRIGGGRLIGPDLKDVTQRKDRQWLEEWMMNPMAKINAGDPYALKILKESNGVPMVVANPIDKKLADELLDFVEAESKLEESEFSGKTAPEIPFTDADVAHGADIFTGAVRLKNGAPPCMSCHSVTGSGAAMGGNLGPNLTKVFERLQGRAALTAWLGSPPTATMQSVFKPHPLENEEINAVVALFDHSAKNSESDGEGVLLWMGVIFYGIGGTLVVLLAFGGFWNGRFRAVRRPLVERSRLKAQKQNKQKVRR